MIVTQNLTTGSLGVGTTDREVCVGDEEAWACHRGTARSFTRALAPRKEGKLIRRSLGGGGNEERVSQGGKGGRQRGSLASVRVGWRVFGGMCRTTALSTAERRANGAGPNSWG